MPKCSVPDDRTVIGGEPFPRMNDFLRPVLVATTGRSGSTALMALLGTAPQIALQQVYPFEHRYLTNLAKAAIVRDRLFDRWNRWIGFNDQQLHTFEDCTGFDQRATLKESEFLTMCLPPRPKAREAVIHQWRLLAPHLRAFAADPVLYAEKVPTWMPAFSRRCFPTSTLYLFRDPRDVFLSANQFMALKRYYSFGRGPGDSDLDHARNLAYDYLCYFENFRADRQRHDTAAVTYQELVSDPITLSQRLNRLLDAEITPSNSTSDFLASHRTTGSVEASLNRWRRESLDASVVRFIERYLQEAMKTIGFEFSDTQEADPRLFDLSSLAVQSYAIDHAATSHGALSAAGSNGLRVTITDDDFHFLLPRIEPFSATSVREVWMCLSGDVGSHCSLFWRSPDDAFDESCSLHVPQYGGSHWRIVRFQVGNHPHWSGTIAELRVDPLNGERPVTPQSGYVRWVRLVT